MIEMINRDIYIDLVSNASMELYPSNTLSSFTNKLSIQIELEGEWEIGLIELFHSNKIHHKKKSVSYVMYSDGLLKLNNTKTTLDYRIGMKIETLLNNINDVFNQITLEDIGITEGRRVGFKPPSFIIIEDKVSLNMGKIWYNDAEQTEYSYFAPLFDDSNFLNMLGFVHIDYNEAVLRSNNPNSTLR